MGGLLCGVPRSAERWEREAGTTDVACLGETSQRAALEPFEEVSIPGTHENVVQVVAVVVFEVDDGCSKPEWRKRAIRHCGRGAEVQQHDR
jgi:hypothetical protein